ncbi:hypothetical protein K2173_012777 [Erythroxylum novogranatense]|uniref:Uncharacterized protein n=1 Tax=Erythroxylum novogranatense TaxID=1862640 RepID=A0AAV8S4S6_9ROSI|nr:hypothetical protein K2173_012777 [Erythroxylum novogranatense]
MSLRWTASSSCCINLELEKVLGDMPKKTFEFKRFVNARSRLTLLLESQMIDALKRVDRTCSGFDQVGDGAYDLEDVRLPKSVFEGVRDLIVDE